MKIDHDPNVSIQLIHENYSLDHRARIGKGTYGRVYRGFQSNKVIAVKVIETKNSTTKYQREIQVMSQLRQKKHPNLLTLYDSFWNKEKEKLYLFLEFCPYNLDEVITLKKLSKQSAYRYLREITSGLLYMHNLNFFHRDIKPENILISDKDTVKIADFGIARQINETVKYTQGKCTPAYSAPELFLKKKYSQKCDMFSLGCVFYEMLTGKRLVPTQIDRLQQLSEFYAKFVKNEAKFDLSDPNIGETDRKLISEMTEADPQRRLKVQTLHMRLQAFEFNKNSQPVSKLPETEEQSFMILSNFKKRLQFRERRCEYFLNVLKIISKYQNLTSKFIPRIYKLAVIFFSLVKYCYSTTELIRNAVNNNLAMQEYGQKPEEINELLKKLTPENQEDLFSYLNELSKRLLIKRTSIRKFIRQQILNKIEAVFQDPMPNCQKAFASELKFVDIFELYRPNVLSQIQQEEHIDFNDKYLICLNNLYRTTTEISQLSNEDLSIYLTLILYSGTETMAFLRVWRKQVIFLGRFSLKRQGIFLL